MRNLSAVFIIVNVLKAPLRREEIRRPGVEGDELSKVLHVGTREVRAEGQAQVCVEPSLLISFTVG